MQVFKLVLLLLLISLLYSCNDSNIKTRSSDRGGGVVEITNSNGSKILSYSGSYALLIGQSDYASGWDDLNSIPDELDDVESVLKNQGFVVERHSNLNFRQLNNTFRRFIDNYGLDENNRLLFFYSGHGYSRKVNKNSKGYIVPVDAPNPSLDTKGFVRKAVEMEQIITWAQRIESKHALFLFDSCFSGTVLKTRDALVPQQITQATKLPVRQFITAGSANEKVPASSTFTPAFVDALRYAKADLYKDGYVTGEELGLYLKNVVSQYTRQTPQYGKINYKYAGGDFVFKLVKSKPKPVVNVAEFDRIKRERDAALAELARIKEERQAPSSTKSRSYNEIIRDIQRNFTKIASHNTPQDTKNYLVDKTIQKYFKHSSEVQVSSIRSTRIRADSIEAYLKRLSRYSRKYKTVKLYFDKSYFSMSPVDKYYEDGKKTFSFHVDMWQMFQACHKNKTCNPSYTKKRFHLVFIQNSNWEMKVDAITTVKTVSSYNGRGDWNIEDVSN